MSEVKARQLYADFQKLGIELSQDGWVDDQSMLFGDVKTSVDLFDSPERPLVVGLFGGTGAGKSSLLNKLAGTDVARTGVVRPTSVEITAYLHEGIKLNSLPTHFAKDRFSQTRHHNAELANVMWVDMPDFDSDETSNKEQVLQWLPLIDLLIYVVTPERYKDAEGWQLLKRHGYQHAWMFVINQWDRAQPEQYDVSIDAHPQDQFDSLLSEIQSLANQQVIALLQERGWFTRLSNAKQWLQNTLNNELGLKEHTVAQSVSNNFDEFKTTALAHLDSSFKNYSSNFDDKKTSAISSTLASLTGKSQSAVPVNSIANKAGVNELWDDWLTVRLDDAFKKTNIALSEHGVPASLVAGSTSALGARAVSFFSKQFKDSVDTALAAPGTWWQRALGRAAAVAKILLPLLAGLWIAYRIINGFMAGAEDQSAYVGFNFVANGLLLVGLGWLVPFVIERVVVPSTPDTVYRELHNGLQRGLEEFEAQTIDSVTSLDKQRHQYRDQLQKLTLDIDQFVQSANGPVDQALQSTLMNPQITETN